MTEPVIRIRDGEFGYGTTVAARVDLAIDAGEFVAVLGPNGSGKSTLVKGMLGVVDRLGGDVEWFGQPAPLRPIGRGSATCRSASRRPGRSRSRSANWSSRDASRRVAGGAATARPIAPP